jgi:acetyltransferase-like isoleucine patch superfamily enzyme
MISLISRFKSKRIRAIAFALSGAKICTLETRVDSTVNIGAPLNDITYWEYEYDPVLRNLLSEYVSQNVTQKSKRGQEYTRNRLQPLFRNWPGIGEIVRRISAAKNCLGYISKLGKVEPPFDISPHAEIRTPHQVSLGIGAVIRAGTILNGRSRKRKFGIKCGPDFYVKEGAYIDAYDGYIEVGKGAAIAQNCAIHGNGGVVIGDYLMMGRGAMILAGNHRYNLEYNIPFIMQGSITKGIRIGNNVWLGAMSIVLDGVKIGDNVVIGAGAIVTHDIPSNSLVVGSRKLRIRALQARTMHQIDVGSEKSEGSIT